MADAAVVGNNGIRHVRAPTLPGKAKCVSVFGTAGGFRDFMTIQRDGLEIHIEWRGVIHHEVVPFAAPFKLIRHIFWTAFTADGR